MDKRNVRTFIGLPLCVARVFTKSNGRRWKRMGNQIHVTVQHDDYNEGHTEYPHFGVLRTEDTQQYLPLRNKLNVISRQARFGAHSFQSALTDSVCDFHKEREVATKNY